MTTRIKSNKAKCLVCHTIAESTNRHHLCFCQCGAMFVDGGQSYLRRGGSDLSKIEELSEYEEIPDPTPADK